MPLYEYVCKRCRKRFERLFIRRTQETEAVQCPDCGGKDCEKVPSVFSSSPCQPGGSFT